MAGYIGKVQIGTDNAVLIGSTLYGICKTSPSTTTKTVISLDDNSGKFINNNYNAEQQGITIHVKFTQGNSVTSGMTLQVGTTSQARNVVGKCVCDANTIISFTYDENQNWVVNDNVNTEYEFMTAYDAINNKVATNADLTALDIQAAAHKGVTTSLSGSSTNDDLPTAASVYSYVQAQTGGLSGLTGAMHFRGIATSEPSGSNIPTGISDYTESNPEPGDVVLYNGKEFVWTGSTWELLGDEGSYALKTNTSVVTGVQNFTTNTLPQLTVTPTTVSHVTVTNGSAASLTTHTYNIPNVTQAGTATTASVSGGILTITMGTNTILGNSFTIQGVDEFTANTPTSVTAATVSVGSASGWSAGSQVVLNTTDTTVVVPGPVDNS